MKNWNLLDTYSDGNGILSCFGACGSAACRFFAEKKRENSEYLLMNHYKVDYFKDFSATMGSFFMPSCVSPS